MKVKDLLIEKMQADCKHEHTIDVGDADCNIIYCIDCKKPTNEVDL